MIEPTTTVDQSAEDDAAEAPDGLVAEELLIEDISIDGMCGVY